MALLILPLKEIYVGSSQKDLWSPKKIFFNEQERKARAADQVFKTEQKASPEKQQEAADRRAASLKEFDDVANPETTSWTTNLR